MLSSKILRLHHDGSLVEHKKTLKSLPIGCVMHYPNNGGDTIGWIVGELDNFGRQRVIWNTDRGYTDGFVQLATTEPLSEKFGIGHYYDDDLKTVSADKIEEIKRFLAVDVDERKQEAIAIEKKNAEISEGLKKEYGYLTVLKDYYDHKETKKNLIKMLKKEYPKTKFSVRKYHYNSYSIEWTDGAPKSGVEKIAKMFYGYSFDSSGDYRDHDPSLFNLLFGSFEFINVTRNLSEPIGNIRSEIKDFVSEHSDRSWDSGSIAYRVCNYLFNDLDLTDAVNKEIVVNYPNPDPIGCEMPKMYSVELKTKM